jgi:hypothetical protein
MLCTLGKFEGGTGIWATAGVPTARAVAHTRLAPTRLAPTRLALNMICDAPIQAMECFCDPDEMNRVRVVFDARVILGRRERVLAQTSMQL